MQDLNDPLWQRGEIHAVAYVVGAAYVQRLAIRSLSVDDENLVEKLHLGMFPLAFGWTAVCHRVWPQHRSADKEKVSKVKLVALGIGLATLSLGSLLLIEQQLGWLHVTSWGTQRASGKQVLKSLAFFTVAQATVAYNEEMFFRGHGLTVLSHLFGPTGAKAILIPMFVLWHPRERPWIAGGAYGLFAINHHLMRSLSGGLTLPWAYHWAWNTLQSAVVVGRPGQLGIVQVEVTGPEAWTGRLGQSYPGKLMVIVQAILTLVLGWLWQQRKR